MSNSSSEEKKVIRIFALASFLNDFGSDMIYPVWPLFVTEVLKANMSVLGFIDGLGEAIVSFSQALSGYISDRIQRRKIFIWIGYFLGALSRIGYALSPTWKHLIPFRVIDRGGKIRSAPRDAIIAEASTDANRGRNFGLLRAMDHLGAVAGILTCLLLINLLGYRQLFMLAALPTLIGTIVILRMIKEKKPEGRRLYKGYDFRHLDFNLKILFTLSALFALASFSYSFLLIFAREFGFKTSLVPVLYLIYSVFAFLTSIPFGRLADKIGRKKVLWMGYGIWVTVCLVFLLGQSKLILILGFIFYGTHKGALEPVSKTLVAELAPPQFKASILGAFQMVVGLCALPASMVAGLLWDNWGKLAPFTLSLLLTLVAMILLFLVKEKPRDLASASPGGAG